ncbi:MAG TPA: TIGR00341 family protein [Humibacillus sp.]|nr:TIGR00341 family protein [Humibacillus sp.]
MEIGLRARVLPENQRRTLDELTSDLDLNEGDIRAKRSAFWTMLVLASCIACAGIIADSTATVIGAMIIAPLSTPIMGTALALVKRERTGGVKFVVLGAIVVIAVGLLFSLTVPSTTVLLENSQVAGRTSPRLVDLIAALATGLAGAVALARRDVAAILPGVAISISLVPPLGVVGIALGEGEFSLAFGALVLFLSNFLALVFAGSLVFTSLGYTTEAGKRAGRSRRSTKVTFGVLVLLVILPMAFNSALSYAYAEMIDRVTAASQRWVARTTGAEIVGVDNEGFTAIIRVSAPGDLPPVAGLMDDLSAQLPANINVVVERSVGERIEAGTTT